MSDPTALPFQEDRSTSPEDSIYEGERPQGSETARAGSPDAGAHAFYRPHASHRPDASYRADASPDAQAWQAGTDAPPPSDTDVLAARVSGPEDHVGMTSLWRLTMDLEHWWFIAVGEEGMESPAAAVIQDQFMLLAFTSAERARHFAVENQMVAPEDDLRAIALTPREVVESATTYHEAGIGGLMFDPHIAGYFIPSEQLPVVWDAVHSTASDVDPAGREG